MANIKEKASVFAPLTRRGFVKAGTITGLAAAAGGFSLPFSTSAAAEQKTATPTGEEKVVWSACTVNCGSRCPLRMHVVDGEIKYVETDNTGKKNCIKYVLAYVDAQCDVACITQTAYATP